MAKPCTTKEETLPNALQVATTWDEFYNGRHSYYASCTSRLRLTTFWIPALRSRFITGHPVLHTVTPAVC